MTAAEPRIPRHRFYAKEHHVQLAREDKDKHFIRGSGIDRIDGGSGVVPVAPEFLFGGLPDFFISAQISPQDQPFKVGYFTVTMGVTGVGGGTPSPVLGLTPVVVPDGMTAQQLGSAVAAMMNGKQSASGLTVNASSPSSPWGVSLRLEPSTNLIAQLAFVFTEGPPPPTLDEQVEAILAGTKGFVLDPQDFSTMWQDSAKTTPVTAVGQPVGLIAGKWGTGTEEWNQPTGAARPVLTAAGILTHDGVDDFLQNSPSDIFRNVPAMFVCLRVRPIDLTNRTLLFFGTSNTGTSRLALRALPAGAVTVFHTKATGSGTPLSVNTPDGAVSAAALQTLSALADYNAGGNVRAWVNGASVLNAVNSDAPGPTGDTAGTVNRLMRASTGTFPGGGSLGRMVVCPFKPTDEQRAVLEAWVAA